MTTNKKKVGEHYYATANVKNKNYNKKKVPESKPDNRKRQRTKK